MFNINSTIVLDDNKKYKIEKKVICMNKTYLFLIDVNNKSNVIYALLDNNILIEISDSEKLIEIAKIMLTNS